jgi:hypothetical protein
MFGRRTASLGVVRWFDADEGWGVIVAPELPWGLLRALL